MSEYWGHCVKDRLSGFGMVGPIVWHPFNQLTVITGLYDPAHLDQRRVSEVLRETDSVLIEPGQVLTLPTPGDSSRGWETPPRNSFRPAMSSVLAALVACVDQRRR
ncbi:hypothetical protein [Nocardia sp. NPDC050710]|uniref:hypothetical protein n=1 Tax=Nocardia sp. NPDC050710 TaxID=3157220 RepID=UPI00340F133C